ncbi:type II CAAX prenyl endopeptidase Rce1 family protein, partial [Chloroflexota bacterium]
MNIPLQLITLSIPSIIYIAVQRIREKKWDEVLGLIGWQSSQLKYYLWSIGVVILVGGLGWLALQLVPQDVLNDPNINISEYAEMTPGVATFLLVWLREAIYVALGEEIFFRGFLGGWLIRRYGFAIGNLIQSLIFLLPHLLLFLVSLSFWPMILVQLLAGWLIGWLR